MPMSSGLLTINAAVLSDTTERRASTEAYPSLSRGRVMTSKPAAAAVAGLHGWAWAVVMISLLWESAPAAW